MQSGRSERSWRFSTLWIVTLKPRHEPVSRPPRQYRRSSPETFASQRALLG
jgi:hypothetical protein